MEDGENMIVVRKSSTDIRFKFPLYLSVIQFRIETIFQAQPLTLKYVSAGENAVKLQQRKMLPI